LPFSLIYLEVLRIFLNLGIYFFAYAASICTALFPKSQAKKEFNTLK